MEKWIDFKNNRCKYVRMLQDLGKSFQYTQKYGQKGHFVILFSDVRKRPYWFARFQMSYQTDSCQNVPCRNGL